MYFIIIIFIKIYKTMSKRNTCISTTIDSVTFIDKKMTNICHKSLNKNNKNRRLNRRKSPTK